jgi:hypothetical protein
MPTWAQIGDDLINTDQLQRIRSVGVQLDEYGPCDFALQLHFAGQAEPVVWHYQTDAKRRLIIHTLMTAGVRW